MSATILVSLPPRVIARAAILAIAILPLLVAGISESQERDPQQGDYVIGAGDVLDVVVWKNEELTRTVPVRPDGWISLPLLNDIRAAGQTPMELREAIAARLTEFVSDPVVSVIVSQIRSFKVTVLGKVRKPGRFELEGPTTILEVLAMAEGFDDYSSPDDLYVLRPQGQQYRRLKVKYSAAVKGEEVNIRVGPGDLVVVP